MLTLVLRALPSDMSSLTLAFLAGRQDDPGEGSKPTLDPFHFMIRIKREMAFSRSRINPEDSYSSCSC